MYWQDGRYLKYRNHVLSTPRVAKTGERDLKLKKQTLILGVLKNRRAYEGQIS